MKINMGPPGSVHTGSSWRRSSAVLYLTKQINGTWAVIWDPGGRLFSSSLIGFCPLYVPLALSTKKKSKTSAEPLRGGRTRFGRGGGSSPAPLRVVPSQKALDQPGWISDGFRLSDGSGRPFVLQAAAYKSAPGAALEAIFKPCPDFGDASPAFRSSRRRRRSTSDPVPALDRSSARPIE
jgi:hypothetical protein